MKNKTHLIALACGVLSLGFGATAHAATVLNPDFSINASAYTSYYGILGGTGAPATADPSIVNPSTIPDWTAVNGDGAIGIGGSDNGQYTFGPATLPVTGDWVFLYHSGYVQQAVTFNANTVYTLTVDVASRGVGTGLTAIPYYIVNDGNSTTTTPTMGVSNFSDAVTGTFQTEMIMFTTTTGGAGYIEFGNNYGGANGDRTAEFTNVTLSGEAVPAVPEPSTWALSLLGSLFGLALLMRRRSMIS